MAKDSAVILDTGLTASIVCSRRLAHRNSPIGNMGLPRVTTYPGQARFKFEDVRIGDVHLAADITVGIAGSTGNFAAFSFDAEIPALLRKRS